MPTTEGAPPEPSFRNVTDAKKSPSLWFVFLLLLILALFLAIATPGPRDMPVQNDSASEASMANGGAQT